MTRPREVDDLAATMTALINLAGEIRLLSSAARVELAGWLDRQFGRRAPAAGVWAALALVVAQVESNVQGDLAEAAAMEEAIGSLERMLNDPDADG